MIKRVVVEKKNGFAVEASAILGDIKSSLGINVANLRLFNVYDVDIDADKSTFEKIVRNILSETVCDDVFEDLPCDLMQNDYKIVAISLQKGQYDQRADSAAQCIQIFTKSDLPTIQTFKVYAIKGVSSADFARIKSFLINPVETCEISLEIPKSLEFISPKIELPEIVTGFKNFNDEKIANYHTQNGFAMTAADLCLIRDYFNSENRDPFITELKVIDTYWSDHCRHTTFLTKLENIKIADDFTAAKNSLQEYRAARDEVYGADTSRPETLMDIAVLGMKLLKKRGILNNLDESDEINACSIKVPIEIDGKTEEWLVQFKNETHNHPTEIEPFGGAATCLGGAIRDPLSGRAYIYQAMRVTGAANPNEKFEDTLPGKLPQKKITQTAAAGYSSYGNQIGLATGLVRELYHEGYKAKRMEVGAVVGACPAENVRREKPVKGDLIVLVGGRTGRDGCGGATGSSKAHDEKSVSECAAEVQKGNPVIERKIQRLFKNPNVSRLIKKCNDFGAGGVSVAIGELADSLEINLDTIPKKYAGLNGTELAISESQERMAVVLEKGDVDAFIAHSNRENLEATVVAKVTDDGYMRMTFQGEIIVNIAREFLDTNGVQQSMNAEIESPKNVKITHDYADLELDEALLKNISNLNVACQSELTKLFDSTVGSGTVLMPLGGKNQLTPEDAMVAKIPVKNNATDDATAFAYGFVPQMGEVSPYHMGVMSVIESVSKLAAVGADLTSCRLSFQEYFEKLGDNPIKWGKPLAALLGAFSAQIGLGMPAIGGKDSMSGSFKNLDVPPTLISFALAMTKASTTGSAAFKNADSRVFLIPLPIDDNGAVDFAKVKSIQTKISEWVRAGKISACSVVSHGGAAANVMKMAFGNGFGFKFFPNCKNILFDLHIGAFVVELANANLLKEFKADFSGIFDLGNTTNSKDFVIGGKIIPHEVALKSYQETFEGVFKTKFVEAEKPHDIALYSKKGATAPQIKISKPNVVIPVFPGTNGEYDLEYAFSRAGADVKTVVLRNLDSNAISESLAELKNAISSAQIMAIPGGFSAGDEPDGSAKFIAAMLKSAEVSEEISNLLNNRDGLIFGVCNGFQALIKLGLVPFGEFREMSENGPTLTFNQTGKHISQIVNVRITSTKSPWLSGFNAGDVYKTPISHGEGRLFASGEIIQKLAENGQIATQYVDFTGAPSSIEKFNPNGSMWAVEGITSPDGRVLGKMGHSERFSENCFKNVTGAPDCAIIAGGVNYFKV